MFKRSSRMATALVISCILLVAGCAAPPRSASTPSGRPEAVMTKAPLKEVQGVLTNHAINSGFAIKAVSDFTAVYEKQSDNVGTAMLFGSRYDATPVWRMTYNFAPVGDDLRVVAMMQVVTNPGSAFERVTDMSRDTVDAVNLQKWLNELREHYTVKAALAQRGKIGAAFSNDGKVTAVVKAGPAELAGLLVDDVVVSIDGAPWVSTNDAVLRVTGAPGTSVALSVKRGGATKDFSVVRGQP